MICGYMLLCHSVPFGANEKYTVTTYSTGTCGTWHRIITSIIKIWVRAINK